MFYLLEDSKYILGQMEDPFAVKGEHNDLNIKREFDEDDTKAQLSKKKKKKGEENKGDLKGYQNATLKLDLKNSKWWQPGIGTMF